ncbi:hypothetical protein SDC9_54475 [bioreactor metagenome]|uniref:Uncharacterized protein n=1 Tax=bioreactor metagenome TaxID=1076179 RepID=A0A644X1J9_9ZZZZ
MKKRLLFLSALALILTFSACDLVQEEPPTKTQMEGVWAVSKVYDTESGQDITSQVNFPITAFQLSSDGTIISTAGPLIMYIVYGDSKYVEIASKIDEVFNYASLDFNGGEFFIGGGVETRFTLEMKLEGLPGQKALTTLLELLGIGNDYLDVVVYHKFLNVKVDFSEDYNTMYWEIDTQTSAVYNTKDNQGNYVLWNGWPVNNFSKVQITLEKQVKDLRDLVEDASN